MILIEAWRFFKHIFALLKDECMTAGIDVECAVRNCEELASHSKEPTVFEYYILYRTIAYIKHNFFYFTKVFLEMVINLISDDRRRCEKMHWFVWMLASVIFARHVISLQICSLFYFHNTLVFG